MKLNYPFPGLFLFLFRECITAYKTIIIRQSVLVGNKKPLMSFKLQFICLLYFKIVLVQLCLYEADFTAPGILALLFCSICLHECFVG